MGNTSSANNPMADTNVRDRILKDVNDEVQKRSTNGEDGEKVEAVSEGQSLSAQKKKPSDEEHPSYTQAEMLEAEENFKTIRRFLDRYHRALGDQNVEQFLKVLDGMKPLKDDNSKAFMEEFNGSEGLANQHLLSQQNILVLWERESLSRYLKFKSQQNRLLVTESTFQTVAVQDAQRDFFYSKYDQNKSSPSGGAQTENGAVKTMTTISFAGEPGKKMELKNALSMIKEQKTALDKLVQVEALHYRAIRELLRINKSNIALIQYLKPSFDESSSTH